MSTLTTNPNTLPNDTPLSLGTTFAFMMMCREREWKGNGKQENYFQSDTHWWRDFSACLPEYHRNSISVDNKLTFSRRPKRRKKENVIHIKPAKLCCNTLHVFFRTENFPFIFISVSISRKITFGAKNSFHRYEHSWVKNPFFRVPVQIEISFENIFSAFGIFEGCINCAIKFLVSGFVYPIFTIWREHPQTL